MKRQQTKTEGQNHKKEKKYEVANLLSGIRKQYGDNDLANAVPLRVSEINSFIQIIHAALETDFHDEHFYRKHIGQMMYLFEERFDELQIMVNALVEKEWNSRKEAMKPAA